MSDPYYKTRQWRRLRAARLRLDNHTCIVAGCGKRAVVVDHIVRRQDGGADSIANTRSLCQVKDRPSGQRANAGKLTVKGCFPGPLAGRPCLAVRVMPLPGESLRRSFAPPNVVPTKRRYGRSFEALRALDG
jgi:hypothetical protein